MVQKNKWEPEQYIGLGIFGAIICFIVGIAILVIGLFNDLLNYWLTSSFWYVKMLAMLCYLGEACIVLGLAISIKTKIIDWYYNRKEVKELVQIAKERR
ncbi:MAG: hypothetical protein PHN69_06045 [Candidatus Pacebacteria bacterium]|nr:hypothetical protein [Candidatus Paceibacterota bacterium]